MASSWLIGLQVEVAHDTPLAGLSGSVLTVAELTGGVAGLLLAFVVFGVELYATWLKRIGFLVLFLVRRDGPIPTTMFAMVVVVVTANVVVGLASTLFRNFGAAVVMAAVDFVMVPVSAGLTFRLL